MLFLYYQFLFIIIPKELLYRLLLPLLQHHPLIIFRKKSMEKFHSLLAIYSSTHLFCNMRRKVIPNQILLSLIPNLIPNNIVQILNSNHNYIYLTFNHEPIIRLLPSPKNSENISKLVQVSPKNFNFFGENFIVFECQYGGYRMRTWDIVIPRSFS